MADKNVAKDEKEHMVELELDHDSDFVPSDLSSDDSELELERSAAAAIEATPSPRRSPRKSPRKAPPKGFFSEKVRFLNPKNKTKFEVITNMKRKARKMDEDDLSAELLEPTPRNSLEDFVLPKGKKCKKGGGKRGRPHGKTRKPMTNDEWIEQVDNAERYLRSGVLPLEIESGGRHSKSNFLNRVIPRFRIIDGLLRYFHARNGEKRGMLLIFWRSHHIINVSLP